MHTLHEIRCRVYMFFSHLRTIWMPDLTEQFEVVADLKPFERQAEDAHYELMARVTNHIVDNELDASVTLTNVSAALVVKDAIWMSRLAKAVAAINETVFPYHVECLTVLQEKTDEIRGLLLSYLADVPQSMLKDVLWLMSGDGYADVIATEADFWEKRKENGVAYINEMFLLCKRAGVNNFMYKLTNCLVVRGLATFDQHSRFGLWELVVVNDQERASVSAAKPLDMSNIREEWTKRVAAVNAENEALIRESKAAVAKIMSA